MTKSPALRGYSLAELIVAVGIFSMVMLIVMGVYLALISYDRQARATNQLVANLSFAIESMVRTIRTGSQYTCTGDPCTAITFNDSEGNPVHYLRRADGTIGQCRGSEVSTCSQVNATPLTDPSVTIGTLSFYVRGVGTTGAAAAVQPQVTILVRGTMATDAGKSIDFTIQTSGTQRVLDIP